VNVSNRLVVLLSTGAILSTLMVSSLSRSFAQAEHPVPTVSTPPHKPVDWHTILKVPSVRAVLKQELKDLEDVEERGDIALWQAADITGDGLSEALVNLGTGGASCSLVTLMRMNGAEPRVAQLRDWTGKVFPLTFCEGASVMHEQHVTLLPDQHAMQLYSDFKDGLPGEKVEKCCLSVFQWSSTTHIFDWSETLSRTRGPECENQCVAVEHQP